MCKWAGAGQNQQNDLCAQRRLQISLGIHPVWSESSLPHEEALGPWLPIKHTKSDWADAQADLGLRWVQVILSVLLCCGSNIKFPVGSRYLKISIIQCIILHLQVLNCKQTDFPAVFISHIKCISCYGELSKICSYDQTTQSPLQDHILCDQIL